MTRLAAWTTALATVAVTGAAAADIGASLSVSPGGRALVSAETKARPA
ncbi:hypothetical protein [Saccharopolyspora hattusasensis]